MSFYDKDYNAELIVFPVKISYYSHHSWLLCAFKDFQSHGIIPAHAAEVNLIWDKYYDSLLSLSQSKDNRDIIHFVQPLVDLAPPSIEYIEADIISFNESFAAIRDNIIEKTADFQLDYSTLYDSDPDSWEELFADFYSNTWEDSPVFKAAVRSHCLENYNDSLINLWACLCPKQLSTIYTLSDYIDDDCINQHQHHWLAYNSNEEYLCTLCGEKKTMIKTY